MTAWHSQGRMRYLKRMQWGLVPGCVDGSWLVFLMLLIILPIPLLLHTVPERVPPCLLHFSLEKIKNGPRREVFIFAHPEALYSWVPSYELLNLFLFFLHFSPYLSYRESGILARSPAMAPVVNRRCRINIWPIKNLAPLYCASMSIFSSTRFFAL